MLKLTENFVFLIYYWGYVGIVLFIALFLYFTTLYD